MLNYIWFALMAIALVVAAFAGTAADVTKGAIDSAKTAVEISIATFSARVHSRPALSHSR